MNNEQIRVSVQSARPSDYNQPGNAIPQTEVGSEIEKLTTQCATLDKQIEELANRLVPVVSLPRTEAATTQGSAPEPTRVPLAQILHERVVHLSQLSDRLQSIISRIEL